MIRVRFCTLESDPHDKDLEIVKGETLSKAVDRVFKDMELGEYSAREIFYAGINGVEVKPENWDDTILECEYEVIVCPRLGDSQTFKTISIIGITLVSAYFLGPAGLALSGTALAAATAAVTVAATLALNALIPPPNANLDLGDTGGQAESQMYSITSQSNNTNKFGYVPKVYGTYLMYPTIAANPYTEIEIDPDTGLPVQYFYAIYDFGFGPMQIDSLSIGTTLLGEYDQVSYALVDLNKPAVSTGPWDDILAGSFSFYKNRVEQQSLSIALNANQVDNGVQSGYEAIRTTTVNPEEYGQTIEIFLAASGGLLGLDSNGNQVPRYVEFQIYFAPTGTQNWVPYNDPNYTLDSQGSKIDLNLYPIDPTNPGASAGYVELSRTRPVNAKNGSGGAITYGVERVTFGWPKGQKSFLVGNPPSGQVTVSDLYLSRLYINGQLAVTGATDFDKFASTGYSLFSSQVGLTQSFPLFTFDYYTATGVYVPVDNSVSGKLTASNDDLSLFVMSGDTTNATYASVVFAPKIPGTYDVKVIRNRAYCTTGVVQTSDNITWYALNTKFDADPIITNKRHTFLELKIKATDQLNGSIQNLSAIVSSVLPVYNYQTSTWSLAATRNPAWVFCDLLCGQVNKRAIDQSRLDLTSISAWAAYCDQVPTPPPDQVFVAPRFESNFVLDYQTTLQAVLEQVANAANASLNIVNGKYGVLIDRQVNTPVQIFTPRNSSGLSSVRNYSNQPDGLIIQWYDPGNTYQVAELTVYNNGFNEQNAVNFQTITSFACTNHEQAWRYGRYTLAQNQLRQETISLNVDFEYLICTRGDYVQIVSDVMRVGGSAARVKSLNGNRITIDDAFEIVAGVNYGYVIRGADGNIENGSCNVVLNDTFDLIGPTPEVGDLIVIGQVDQVVYDCIVKSITPADDMSAQIVLVEKADGIYESESTDVLPDYDPLISATSNPNIAAPGKVQNLQITNSGYRCGAGAYIYFVDLSWSPPIGSNYEFYQVFVGTDSTSFNQIAETRNSTYEYILSSSDIGQGLAFKVLAVTADGKKLDLGAADELDIKVNRKSTPPSDVPSLNIDVTSETLQLFWDLVPDCGIANYVLRFSPVLTATWEQSIPLLTVAPTLTLASAQARTGVYFIKAVDWEGNESFNASEAITTIPGLVNLNIIELFTDSPIWQGEADRVIVDGSGAVILDFQNPNIYYPEGFYYYENLLDLGDIYTVRLQSLLQASGFTPGDLMSNWTELDLITALNTTRHADWDVEAQYRSTNNLNVIADFLNLTNVLQLSSGTEDKFTEWRKFIGPSDATGRIFQFRLRLISYKSSVTPRVFDGTIRADMPDRIDSANNIQGIVGGVTVTYVTPFAGPGTTPNVQISINTAQAGDYWSFDSRNLTGFKIRFYNSAGTEVARNFDWLSKGFGRKALTTI